MLNGRSGLLSSFAKATCIVLALHFFLRIGLVFSNRCMHMADCQWQSRPTCVYAIMDAPRNYVARFGTHLPICRFARGGRRHQTFKCKQFFEQSVVRK